MRKEKDKKCRGLASGRNSCIRNRCSIVGNVGSRRLTIDNRQWTTDNNGEEERLKLSLGFLGFILLIGDVAEILAGDMENGSGDDAFDGNDKAQVLFNALYHPNHACI